ncbi:MAG: signal peptidase I [Chloroflexota bacterium]|nr:MAG: signal peptidase I [Chloroflexota bacterium]
MDHFHTETIPEPQEIEEKRSGLTRFVIDIVETLILSVILFVAINAVSARIRVDGASMEPTLQSGEFVIVNKLAYYFGDPATGDVIVFHFPRDPDQEYIKRIIGLPGDQVEVKNGEVYVNGNLLEEDYIAASPVYQDTWTVPGDSLFVLGDNRNNSSDSHNWGTVPLDYVIGKATFVYWPPTEWGLLKHPAASAAP